jgi:hypothetical protein
MHKIAVAKEINCKATHRVPFIRFLVAEMQKIQNQQDQGLAHSRPSKPGA